MMLFVKRVNHKSLNLFHMAAVNSYLSEENVFINFQDTSKKYKKSYEQQDHNNKEMDNLRKSYPTLHMNNY